MIEMNCENLISLREVPRHLPTRPNGKRVHISAIYRWVSRGVRGVKLEAIRIGGTMYTSTEALGRFGMRLNDAARSAQLPPDSPARKRQVDQASQRLRSLLGPASTSNKDGGGQRSLKTATAKQ
jgi:hypothetical protein